MYTGLSNLGLSGYHSQYSELKEQAIAAARRNNASLWFAGAPADLAGFVWQDSAGTTPATGTDPIGRLVDRAGSNAATQATAANKPTLELQANGFFGMRFVGPIHNLSIPLIGQNINSQTVIVAGRCTSAANDKLATGYRSVGSSRSGWIEWAGQFPRYVLGTDAGAFVVLSDPTARINVDVVVSASSPGAAGFRHLYVNGASVASTAYSALGASTPTSGTIGAATLGMIGLIHLVCQSPAFMPDADRIAIERFAALLSGAAYV